MITDTGIWGPRANQCQEANDGTGISILNEVKSHMKSVQV